MALCLLVTAVRGQRNVHFTVAPDVYTKLRGLMPGRGVKTVWPMAPPDGPVSLGVDVYCYLGQPSNECTYDDQNDPPQWVTFCLVDPAAAVHNVRFNMLTEDELPLNYRRCTYSNICGNIYFAEPIPVERLVAYGATRVNKNMFGESHDLETAQAKMAFSEYNRSVGLKGMRNLRGGLAALQVATLIQKELSDVHVYMCVVKGALGRSVSTVINGFLESMIQNHYSQWFGVQSRTEEEAMFVRFAIKDWKGVQDALLKAQWLSAAPILLPPREMATTVDITHTGHINFTVDISKHLRNNPAQQKGVLWSTDLDLGILQSCDMMSLFFGGLLDGFVL